LKGKINVGVSCSLAGLSNWQQDCESGEKERNALESCSHTISHWVDVFGSNKTLVQTF